MTLLSVVQPAPQGMSNKWQCSAWTPCSPCRLSLEPNFRLCMKCMSTTHASIPQHQKRHPSRTKHKGKRSSQTEAPPLLNNIKPAPSLPTFSKYRALVLDTSYRPIDIVNWQRAICLDIFDKVGDELETLGSDSQQSIGNRKLRYAFAHAIALGWHAILDVNQPDGCSK